MAEYLDYLTTLRCISGLLEWMEYLDYLTMYVGETSCPFYGLGLSSDVVLYLAKGLPENKDCMHVLIIGLNLKTDVMKI